MDYNMIIGVLTVVVLTIFFIYLKTNNKTVEYYKEIKLALLIAGISFRDEKVKSMASLVMDIVKDIEELDISPVEKQAEAIQRASVAILGKFNIVLDEDIIALIIDVAVSYIPKTNK